MQKIITSIFYDVFSHESSLSGHDPSFFHGLPIWKIYPHQQLKLLILFSLIVPSQKHKLLKNQKKYFSINAITDYNLTFVVYLLLDQNSLISSYFEDLRDEKSTSPSSRYRSIAVEKSTLYSTKFLTIRLTRLLETSDQWLSTILVYESITSFIL